MNPQYISPVAKLALRAATKFKEDYIELSKEIFRSDDVRNGLHHAAEFGRYREQLLKSFLGAFLPSRLAIGDGFIAPPMGKLSTQCDVIIYERDANPHLVAEGGRALFPIEVCVAVGEVKSKLTFSELQSALEKLRKTKQMRAEMEVVTFPIAPVEVVISASAELKECVQFQLGAWNHLEAAASMYRPAEREDQNLVTFIVCEEIDWPAEKNYFHSFNSLYTSTTDLHLRHNFILSLKQGLLSYFYSLPEGEETRRIPYPYPVQSRQRIIGIEDNIPIACGWRWLPAGNKNHHIMTFAAELIHAVGQVPVYQFDPQAHSLDPQGYDFEYFPFS